MGRMVRQIQQVQEPKVVEEKKESALIYASTLMSDKGYQESTHEKQQEFAKKRNQRVKE
jgi:hypothetical protein